MRAAISPLVLLAACGGGPVLVLLPASQFRVLGPSDGGAANGATPEVRWTRVVGAASYEVCVYGDEARTDLLEKLEGAGDRARLAVALADGQLVFLRVRALAADGSEVARDETRCKVVVLPDSFPPFEVVVHDAARAQGGYRLFNVLTREPAPNGIFVPALLLANAAGEIVWFAVRPQGGSVTDARVLDNGNLLYVYVLTTNGGPVVTEAFEMTWDGQIVWKSPDGLLVHHEVGPGPGGQILALTYEFAEFDGETYEGDGLALIDPATNDVTWEWNIFDHLTPEDLPLIEPPETGRSGGGLDWTHANSAVWDEARGLIWVSLRMFDRILGVAYPGGEIAVTLGSGGLGGPDAMSHQHAPEVQADGTILFFDNGNRHQPPRTRVVVADFDAATGRYDEVFAWTDTPPFFDVAVGDADRLPNGNILVTAGFSARLIEITPQGDVVWDFRADPETHLFYRSEHVPEERIPAGVLPFR